MLHDFLHAGACKAACGPIPASAKVSRTAWGAGPRTGTKTAQVVALLQRKNGATLIEIMQKWAG